MHSQFLVLTVIWFMLFAVLSVHFWRKRSVVSGIAFTHGVILTSAHALQGFVYTIPWYTPRWDPEVVFLGYLQAVIAFGALTFGYMIFIPAFGPLLSTKHSTQKITTVVKDPLASNSFLQQRLPVIYLIIGMFSQLVLIPLVPDIPTISAAAVALSKLYSIGLALILFRAIAETQVNYVQIGLVGVGGIALILNTVLAEGFIGFALPTLAFLTVYTLFRLLRVRLILPIAAITFFVGLSLMVTYYTQRNEIRGVVWGGADFESRVTTVQDTLINSFSLFDINNQDHLLAIDERLSLNSLIGLSVVRLDRGIVHYAQGQTLLDALSTLIPRILWPDKPVLIGGNYLVSVYTGLYFNSRTAVALGQVQEFYVNFGTLGVIIGFISLSTLLYIVDRKVARAIKLNDLMSVAIWLSPAFSLWLVEDNYVTALGSAVSTVLTVILVNVALRVIFSERLTRPIAQKEISLSHSVSKKPS